MFTKNDKNKPDDVPNTKAGESKGEVTAGHEKITEDEVKLAAETLVGDIRDGMLQEVRILKKPWQQLSEAEQKEVVDRVTKRATQFAENGVRIMAAKGRTTIVATLEEIVIKDTIKGKITVNNTEENRHLLGNARGTKILLVTGDSSQFEGEREGVTIDPDQGDLEREIAKKSSNAKTGKSAA